MKKSLVAGFFYFLIVGTAGVVFGALREMFLVPSLGKTFAVVLELPVMLLISWYGCRLLVRLVNVPENVVARLAMGATAFALLMAMEQALQFALSTFVVGTGAISPWTPGDYLGLAGQVAFALFPLFISADTEPETPQGSSEVPRRGRGRVPVSRQ